MKLNVCLVGGQYLNSLRSATKTRGKNRIKNMFARAHDCKVALKSMANNCERKIFLMYEVVFDLTKIYIPLTLCMKLNLTAQSNIHSL